MYLRVCRLAEGRICRGIECCDDFTGRVTHVGCGVTGTVQRRADPETGYTGVEAVAKVARASTADRVERGSRRQHREPRPHAVATDLRGGEHFQR